MRRLPGACSPTSAGIRDRARALPKLTPPPALWEKVRAEFEAERQTGGHPAQARNLNLAAAADPIGSRGGTDSSRQAASLRPQATEDPGVRAAPPPPARRPRCRRRAGACRVGGRLLRRARAPPTRRKVESAAAHASPAESVQSIETELHLAVQHYQNAIAGLEKVASEGQTVLGPADRGGAGEEQRCSTRRSPRARRRSGRSRRARSPGPASSRRCSARSPCSATRSRSSTRCARATRQERQGWLGVSGKASRR